ncbi:NfeD family protein [Salipiger sp.]|uniref:NfeD family protein n=1 Tax=Salipiger sp. TaxID=2078585 RepID=UPI003A97F503
MIHLWWIWASAAVLLLVLEMFAPGFIFLGFGLGAAAVSIWLLVGYAAGWPWLVLIFAVVSLLSWIALRQLVGVRKGQVKLWERDINED